jgi:hypothetical protein
MYWYRDNNYPMIANEGNGVCASVIASLVTACQNLYLNFSSCIMEINHSKFFEDLGYGYRLYNEEENRFEEEEITNRIEDILNEWSTKYSNLTFDTGRLKFGNRIQFNQSFLTELSTITFEA